MRLREFASEEGFIGWVHASGDIGISYTTQGLNYPSLIVGNEEIEFNIDPEGWNEYRIVWTETGVTAYLNGQQKATSNASNIAWVARDGFVGFRSSAGHNGKYIELDWVRIDP